MFKYLTMNFATDKKGRVHLHETQEYRSKANAIEMTNRSVKEQPFYPPDGEFIVLYQISAFEPIKFTEMRRWDERTN